ncbi:MAG TPA: DUF2975 domain-containing protein [Aliiroseovarius sp.]|nr:DUF2975 domain-containing protein [Aliiroseovarius sp.]
MKAMPNRIARLSVVLQWICRIALVILPLSMVAAAIYSFRDPSMLAPQFPGLDIAAPPGPAPLAIVFGLLAVPQLMALFVLWQLERLFGLYRRGDTLTTAPALRIRRIGLGVVAAALLSLLLRPVAGAILTLGNPAGERQLVVTLSSADIGLVLAGGLMVVIGWVMGEAARIAEENRGFV